MPKVKLNDEGQLVLESGEPFEIDGETVEIEGAFTKAQVTQTVEERLGRERAKHEELKKAAEQVPSLQKLADESSAKVRELEAELEQTKTSAAQETAAQLAKARQETERYRSESEQRANELVRFQVETLILGKAGKDFNEPSVDVVPHLLKVHKREPVKGEDGKPTGEFKDFFKLRHKNDQGEEVEEFLPVDKALEVWAAAYPHHLKPSGSSGSGGGHYNTNPGNKPRSKMSLSEKTEFVKKFGRERYEALPE